MPVGCIGEIGAGAEELPVAQEHARSVVADIAAAAIEELAAGPASRKARETATDYDCVSSRHQGPT